MGTIKSKPQINSECPICYQESTKSNGIVLSCGHYYNFSCIQKHCLKTIYHFENSKCPLCNENIKKRDIRKIYKKPYILSCDPVEWFRKDIYNLGNFAIMNNIQFNVKYFQNENMLIIVPLFKTSRFFLPGYLYSTTLSNIKITDHELFNTSLTKELLCGFDTFPELLMCIEATSLEDSIDWINFINKIIYYLGKNDLARDISDIRKDKMLATFRQPRSNQKYRFFLPADTSQINFVDVINEMIKKGFDYDGSLLSGISFSISTNYLCS